jgi:hypothetical protein
MQTDEAAQSAATSSLASVDISKSYISPLEA